MKRSLSAIATASMVCVSLWAQHRVLPVPQIGIGMQSVVYQGDLAPKDSAMQAFTPGGVVSLCFPGKRLSPSINAAFGAIQGQQTAPATLATPPAGVTPNQFVETPFTAITMRLRWSLLTHTRLAPYLSPGVGLTLFDPHDNLGNSLSANPKSRLSSESYTGVAFAYSLGAGVLLRLADQHFLQIEANYTPIATDYLDNIGQLGKVQGNDRIICLQVGILIGLGKGKTDKLEQRAGQDSVLVSAMPAPVPADTARTALNMPIAEIHMDEFPYSVENAIRQYDFIYYPVKRTDRIDSLAAHFQVPVAAIEQLNFIRQGDTLTKGMILRLPNTIWGSNNLPMNAERLEKALDNKQFIYYKVRKGETLQMLSHKSGIPVATIRQLNFLFTSDVEAGDLLRMPDISAK